MAKKIKIEPIKESVVLTDYEGEMKQSFIDYAMSVITDRAIADIRDGLKPVHRRILYSMYKQGFTPDKSYRKSASVVGECFIKGTLVSTTEGLIPIEELNIGDKVYTQSGIEKISQVYFMPKQELVKVELENGLTNVCTKKQQFKVFTKDLEYIWKNATDLSDDDYIVLRMSHNEKLHYIKVNELLLDEDLAYFLGYFMADGWIDKDLRGYNRICFKGSFGKKGSIKNIKRILSEKYNIKFDSQIKDPETARINKSVINNSIISAFNLLNKKAETIFIPKEVFISPTSVKFAFISGFIDGDGSVHKNRNLLSLSSISKDFINKMQVLLFEIGIPSMLYKIKPKESEINGRKIISNNILYSLEISSKFYENLKNELSLSNEDLTVKYTTNNIKSSSFDRIPYIAPYIFEEFSSKHLGGGWYVDKNGKKFRSGIKNDNGYKFRYSKNIEETFSLNKNNLISLNILNKMKMIDSKYLSLLEEILNNDLIFVKVKNIKNVYEQETYDIQVENKHEFIANGMIVHNCLGKYHPHGDMAIYESLVRLAQDFSMRHVLIDGHGNFGSIDGDSFAAQRYTECKLAPLGLNMLEDLNKDIIDFKPNYDEKHLEPMILPAKFPNLLVNGCIGIAVGMATNIPTHNLKEVIDATIAYMDDPDISISNLMKYVKGPDFPTGGIITNKKDLLDVYTTGRGSITIRSKMNREDIGHGKYNFVVTEIPYTYSGRKTQLIDKIIDLVNRKKLDELADVRDESSREGIRIVLETKRGVDLDKLENKLYEKTPLQDNLSANFLTLIDNKPVLVDLKTYLEEFVKFQRELYTRKYKLLLNTALDRKEILDGLMIVYDEIDVIIELLRGSKKVQTAKNCLMTGDTTDITFKTKKNKARATKFSFSERQAVAILEIKLQKLVSLEKLEIEKELNSIIKDIASYEKILKNTKKLDNVIKRTLLSISNKFSTKRLTKIGNYKTFKVIEEVIEEDLYFLLDKFFYIRTIDENTFNRAEADFFNDYRNVIKTKNTSRMCFFTNDGKLHQLKVMDMPKTKIRDKGIPLANQADINEDSVIKVMPFPTEVKELLFLSESGFVKIVDSNEFETIRTTIIASKMRKNDKLIKVLELYETDKEIAFITKDGYVLKISLNEIPRLKKNSIGVTSMKLTKGNFLTDAVILREDTQPYRLGEGKNSIEIDLKELKLRSRNTRGTKFS